MLVGLGLEITRVVSKVFSYLVVNGDFLVTDTGDFIILE